jgi:four helix bundle protein
MSQSNYRNLKAWQKARALARTIYEVTASFPSDERFGLTSQLRRAAVSVPSNIAEGDGRLTNGEWRHFLGQARGSLLEIETEILLAMDFGYLSSIEAETASEKITKVVRILNGLIRSIGK